MPDTLTFCRKCGGKLPEETAEKCSQCGELTSNATEKGTTVRMAHPIPHKSPGTAALIAFIGGICGLPGIGHIYVGRIGRGLLILFSGLILFIIGLMMLFGTAVMGFARIPAGFGAGIAGVAALPLVYAGIWIWQIFNARTLAKRYNEHVIKTGQDTW